MSGETRSTIPAETRDGVSRVPKRRSESVASSLMSETWGPDKPTLMSPSRVTTGTSHAAASSAQFKFEDVATCIEGLAWGRHQCHKYPHKSCLRFESQNHHHPSRRMYVAEDMMARLPEVETARRLIEFHVRFLSWYHNVLHVPTFLAQCEKFWDFGSVEDGQWLAVYCAMMSVSAWSLDNCPMAMERFGIPTCPSPTDLFAMVCEMLNQEDFLGRHSLHSLQSICISEMVANVVGKSDTLITWLSAGIRIAQCLGLHRIGPDAADDDDDDDDDERYLERLEKEIGRRVWWKLVAMDYHSIPYTGGTYSIHLRHCSTEPPRNCNDDLHSQSERALTLSTYALTQARRGVLIPALLDGPSRGDDAVSRYEHVIAIDRQMRQLVAGIPPHLLRQPHSDGLLDDPEWLTVARRTLAIAAADKIIMIHRAFLLKSFESPAYLFTRQTCVSAARTILREHDEISKAGPDCPPIWIHSAFCVAAIVVVCLELRHCHSTMSTERKDDYVQLIRDARQRLSLSKHDAMAHRGVHLVDAMLNEQLYSTSHCEALDGDATRHKFSQIVHRFMQLNRDEKSGPEQHPDSVCATTAEQLENFHVWFDSLFR
ncbi:hypothetical protein ACEQ8H_002736 [Pleosporales sp. CAS-2024a]